MVKVKLIYINNLLNHEERIVNNTIQELECNTIDKVVILSVNRNPMSDYDMGVVYTILYKVITMK